jgi:ethanolamine utilization protein EutN
MELGKVTGQVVATVRARDLPHNSLLLVELLDSEGGPTGESHVALDPIGAGEGEWVILVRGSSARKAVNDDSPLDLAVVGIVDQVSCGEKTLYRKNG